MISFYLSHFFSLSGTFLIIAIVISDYNVLEGSQRLSLSRHTALQGDLGSDGGSSDFGSEGNDGTSGGKGGDSGDGVGGGSAGDGGDDGRGGSDGGGGGL